MKFIKVSCFHPQRKLSNKFGYRSHILSHYVDHTISMHYTYVRIMFLPSKPSYFLQMNAIPSRFTVQCPPVLWKRHNVELTIGKVCFLEVLTTLIKTPISRNQGQQTHTRIPWFWTRTKCLRTLVPWQNVPHLLRNSWVNSQPSRDSTSTNSPLTHQKSILASTNHLLKHQKKTWQNYKSIFIWL